ncbi:MAG: AmmeMemoRadiSam system protein B, partial [Candidatus Bilamarchaeaceae archaeon]
GAFRNDAEFGDAMLEGATFIKKDEVGHRFEHSIEVQLPFLSIVNPKAKIVPICMAEQGIEGARDVANSVLRAEKKLGREAVFIASSDFSHYVGAEWADKEDHKALAHITKLDAEGFQDARRLNDWSICGFGPISAAMLYAREKGSKKGLELMYINSGRASGDYSSVVAYASVAFLR